MHQRARQRSRRSTNIVKPVSKAVVTASVSNNFPVKTPSRQQKTEKQVTPTAPGGSPLQVNPQSVTAEPRLTELADNDFDDADDESLRLTDLFAITDSEER